MANLTFPVACRGCFTGWTAKDCGVAVRVMFGVASASFLTAGCSESESESCSAAPAMLRLVKLRRIVDRPLSGRLGVSEDDVAVVAGENWTSVPGPRRVELLAGMLA